MGVLANMKLRWKLVAITIFPVISLLYYALDEVNRDIAALEENERILRLVNLSIKASSLVHEFQKERGLTAGYIGSGGTRFKDELAAERKLVDENNKRFANTLKQLDIKEFGEGYVKQLKVGLEMKKKLADMRKAIDTLSIPKAEALGYYTKMNTEFIVAVKYLPKLSSESELSNLATAYVNFLKSKERAGIERAVMTATFTADKFDDGVYNRFQKLVTIQDTYLDVFDSLAPKKLESFYKKTVTGEPIEETKRMRAIAAQNYRTGNFNVDGSHWFSMQTAKINLLKKVEDKIAEELVLTGEKFRDYASRALYISLAIMFGALIFTAIILFNIQKVITRSIFKAVEVANEIAKGKLDNHIEVQGTDEASQLLCSLKSMQENLAEQLENERKQAEENSRVLQALDNVTANVMLADESLNVMYINTTLKRMFADQQATISTEIAGFSVDSLIGSSSDSLLQTTQLNSETLRSLEGSKGAEIHIANIVYYVIANPVLNAEGKRLGTVLEWQDLTEQRDAEKQVEKVISAASVGQLSARLDADRYQGFMNTLANGVNQLLDAIVGPLNVAANYVERISRGDIPSHITEDYQGDFSNLKNNLNTCIDAVSLLVKDSDMLVQASVQGQLSVRADASQHQGDFKKIIEGVNSSLDAIINPLTVAAEYVDSIAKGDIPEHITHEYNGDFNKIKDNLNTCIDAINLLISDANYLSDAAVDGQLSTRADADRHSGDFRKVVEGVNLTLDAVINPLTVAADCIDSISVGEIPEPIDDKFAGDFSQLKNNLNTCIDAITLLVEDANMLADSAVAGDLQSRADADNHRGDFKRIVQGVNNALDAMVEPINETNDIMSALADGDMTRNMSDRYNGDFATLSNAVNTSIDNLRDLIGEVIESANNIERSSSEISAGVLNLSQRTEQQASSLEETAASMEEMTSTVKQNAENAHVANDLAADAHKCASHGGDVVGDAVNSMEEINTSSSKISDIITVIDEIAFQTNLLALNAAVEAARAGDMGRGFAVVAGEVRSLAQRSAEAAKEIKDLIRDSVTKVEEGSQLVNRSGDTLLEIVASVDKVTGMIANISTASSEQSEGIEQVNKAISQMDEMTQQNAALVEQASAASESMTSQAGNMITQLSAFKTQVKDY